MMNDDDKLDEFDLSAWEAPPPPADLADAVIERMGGTLTDVAVAVPVEERGPRRGWIIAGAAVGAIALALGVWSLVRSSRPAAPTNGAVVAERAQTLSLDTVTAELDPGAEVRWTRKGDTLYVEQRGGRVAWRVDDGEKLVIDAGAASASVEATGANLRVEVQMNATDARVIGATAVTAAAVSIVTVVVYEGYVKAGKSNQQTVVVAPGSTYKINAAEEDDAPVVGSAPVDVKLARKVAVLGLELIAAPNGTVGPEDPVISTVLGSEIRGAAKWIGNYQLVPGADKELVDVKLLHNCASEAPQCMAAIGATFGADALVFGKIERGKRGYDVTLKLVDVAKKAVVHSGQWQIPTAEAEGEGLTTWANRMYGALVGATSTTCNADELKEQGMQGINMGEHAEALEKFEQSLICQYNDHTVQLAFMASCASGNSTKAKIYYKRLAPAKQQRFAQMCIRNKTAYEDDDDVASAGCDEVSCVLNNYEGDCCNKFKKQQSGDPETLDRAAISAGIAKVKAKVMACGKAGGGKVKATVQVRANGTVASVKATAPNQVLGDCVEAAIETAQFAKTQKGGSFSYPFVFPAAEKKAAPEPQPAPRAPEHCDADALKEKGMQNINMGQHAAALVQFEASLRCKSSTHGVQLAFMAACASGNATKAKVYYKQLAPDKKERFKQICVRNNTVYE